VTERITTGVPGFDELVEGGLPKGSVILLSGSPGTGKTIFCLETLYRGCELGEYGIFLSFEQSDQDILSQVDGFSWDLKKHLKSGKLIVKHVDILAEQNIFDLIKEIVPKNANSVRLVIDSLTALQNYPAMLRNADRLVGLITQKQPTTSISEDSIRRMLIHYFISALKNLNNTTSLLITDVPDESNLLSSDGISEFMCDGIISMYFLGLGGENSRNLQVRKMRWTNQKKGFFPFAISKDGVSINADGSSVLMK